MVDPEKILAATKQQTNIDEVDRDGFMPGLRQLAEALNNEAPLNERGWQSMERTLLNTLSSRIRVDDYLTQHPALLEKPVDKPLFVFGLPRTGTTLTINLLHQDPARRSLLRWEAFNSVPPPKAGELSSDPRCLKEQAALDIAIKHAPQISAIHHEDADSPTECQFIMSQSFCAQYFEAMVEIPSYRKWWLHTSYLPTFRYHKRLLQLLQSAAPGCWTLKNPWHALYLDDLTAVYPDARLVMTHRDPADVVASFCSLIKHVRAMLSDKVDLRYIGETALDTFEKMIERTLAYKNRHGWDSIYDLQYDALMNDPIGEMKKLYRHFNESWSEAVESPMTAFLAGNQQGRHGRHQYSLEEYGLTKGMVRERFADYCRRFDIRQRA